MAPPSILTLRELTQNDLPPSPDSLEYSAWVDAAVSASLKLVASIPVATATSDDAIWAKGKSYNGAQTYSTRSAQGVPGAGETLGFKWHVRQSIHGNDVDQLSYDEFERGLLLDHSLNEAKYIESCTEAKRVQVIKQGELEVWQTLYHLPFPASDRDFAFAILTVRVPESAATIPNLRAFLVVSIPFAHPRENGYTRGRYVSVEHVAEMPDGNLQWTMAVSSSAGGLVPKMISEHSMPSKISEDVPSFVAWAKKEFKSAA